MLLPDTVQAAAVVRVLSEATEAAILAATVALAFQIPSMAQRLPVRVVAVQRQLRAALVVRAGLVAVAPDQPRMVLLAQRILAVVAAAGGLLAATLAALVVRVL